MSDFILPERIVGVPTGADGLPLDKNLRQYDPARDAAGALPAPEAPFKPFDPSDYPRPTATPTPAVPAVAAAASPPVKKREKVKAEFIGERAAGKAYTLADPLRVGDVEYRETRICSPLGSKFGTMQSYLDDGVDDEDVLIWLTCELPIEVVENLSFEDKMELKEQGAPFLPRRMRVAMETEAAQTTKADTTTS